MHRYYKHFLKIVPGTVIGILIFAFLSALFSFGLFSSWQNRLSDTLFTDRTPNGDIVIIAIDDASIQKIGRFPWDRTVYAQLLDRLNTDTPPDVIGIDISFPEESERADDEAFAMSIRNLTHTDVVLASEFNDSILLEPIESLRSMTLNGYVNTTVDTDGVTRKVALWDSDMDSFSFQVAKSYTDTLPPQKQTTRINFAGSPGTFLHYPFVDVLEGRVDTSNFAGKIVLIGATAPDLHDTQTVPVAAQMSGVEIQANAIDTILSGTSLNPESSITTLITVLAISMAGSVAFTFLPPVAILPAAVVVGLLFILYSIYSFDTGIVRNLMYPLLAILLVGVANIIYKYLTESRAKRFLRRMFSFYLSEQVLSHLIDHPEQIKLGGERKELTVLFSDIAGFTSISEKMDPHELVHMLNEYLTRMTGLVFKHNGVLDKYIGDAVMAFWGAPVKDSEHALSACLTALEMQQAVQEYDFDIRIGINSGDMAVGNMGSEQRFDYTLIGDNVNLGSRLEGINKVYGTKICISHGTYTMVKGKVVARKLDTVAVKGKKDGVSIYELRSIGTISSREKKFLEAFEQARFLYEKGDFKKAHEAFVKVNTTYPHDSPTVMYMQRIEELMKNPPDHWTGVYHATEK